MSCSAQTEQEKSEIWYEPKRSRVDGISYGEVSSDGVIVALVGEDPDSSAKSLLQVGSFLEFIREYGRRSQRGHLSFAHVERSDLVAVF